MKKNHNLVSVTAMLIHETLKESSTEGAYLISTDGKDKVWLPKREVEKHPTKKVDEFEFEMPTWLAEEKGLV